MKMEAESPAVIIESTVEGLRKLISIPDQLFMRIEVVKALVMEKLN